VKEWIGGGLPIAVTENPNKSACSLQFVTVTIHFFNKLVHHNSRTTNSIAVMLIINSLSFNLATPNNMRGIGRFSNSKETTAENCMQLSKVYPNQIHGIQTVYVFNPYL
jgi:hypothetical protein